MCLACTLLLDDFSLLSPDPYFFCCCCLCKAWLTTFSNRKTRVTCPSHTNLVHTPKYLQTNSDLVLSSRPFLSLAAAPPLLPSYLSLPEIVLLLFLCMEGRCVAKTNKKKKQTVTARYLANGTYHWLSWKTLLSASRPAQWLLQAASQHTQYRQTSRNSDSNR